MTAIVCTELCKTFSQGGATIVGLDRVSIGVEEGEFVCLSGPSGSGKTTLLNAMGGLDTPDSGEVWVGGQRIDLLSKIALADMRLNNIGFVFQAYNLIPVLSASENIEFVMQVQGASKAERVARVSETLEEVGLAGMGDRLPSQLSGGQQQRVAIARAIASNPRLVLADEPTANLDSKTAEQLMTLFSELNARRTVTFVIATHDQRVMAHCKRLVAMEDGKIVNDTCQKNS
ncbi:ABC transporter ATP-binding protein [Teredinibacter purpureus]|uniref:ABC transporter ATP-binding protein n=1 Tax=Teredinibacter purpureus TaxID=2731756 RepID=UPI0005F7F305|nr:ABC transporter ATP-binding protein [Teredinibacter purpureus]